MSSIAEIIGRIYSEFSKYKISDLENVTFYDYGPSQMELEGISKPVREIPERAIDGMEFFSYEFNEWGTAEEVKYLLPRMLEYLSTSPEGLYRPGFFSFFKYKLKNCILKASSLLDENERSLVADFFRSFLISRLNSSEDINMLIECAVEIGIEPAEFIELWKPEKKLLVRQLAKAYRHFEIKKHKLAYGPCLYSEENEKVYEILGAIFGSLSDDEWGEVIKLSLSEDD